MTSRCRGASLGGMISRSRAGARFTESTGARRACDSGLDVSGLGTRRSGTASRSPRDPRSVTSRSGRGTRFSTSRVGLDTSRLPRDSVSRTGLSFVGFGTTRSGRPPRSFRSGVAPSPRSAVRSGGRGTTRRPSAPGRATSAGCSGLLPSRALTGAGRSPCISITRVGGFGTTLADPAPGRSPLRPGIAVAGLPGVSPIATRPPGTARASESSRTGRGGWFFITTGRSNALCGGRAFTGRAPPPRNASRSGRASTRPITGALRATSGVTCTAYLPTGREWTNASWPIAVMPCSRFR